MDAPASASWEWLVEGYRRAYDRFKASADARDKPEERFIPLFETLNWVVAIMEYPGADHLHRDEIVLGLKFARDRVHHQLANALEPRDVPFPQVVTNMPGGSRIISPPIVLDWFWMPVDQLPKPPARFMKTGYRVGKKAYNDRLAAEPVEHALAHLSLIL